MRRFVGARFASLSVRNYRLFFFGEGISFIGNWMQKLAQAWLVLELTNSGTWLGIVLAAQQLPLLLLSPWAGLLADRYSKRKIMLIAAGAAAIPATTLGVMTLTGHATIHVVLVLAFVYGVADALDKPARHSFPVEMVGPELLPNAVILNNIAQDIGKALGPAIAGLLIASVGTPYTFLINAVSYLAVIGGLLLMRTDELDTPRPITRSRGQLREGLAYVRRTPHLLGPLMLLACAGLFAYNIQVLLPLLGRDEFGGDARTVGYLLAFFGIGSICGGLLLASLIRPNPTRICLAGLAFGAIFLLTSTSPNLAVASVLIFVLGAGSVLFKTMSSAWLQLTSDAAMRGRVLSLLVLALAGTSPFGAPLLGAIAQHLGPRYAFLVAGVATMAAALGTLAYLRRHERDSTTAFPEGVPALRETEVPLPLDLV